MKLKPGDRVLFTNQSNPKDSGVRIIGQPVVEGIQLMPGLVIEPQASSYHFISDGPRRVGDLSLIQLSHTPWKAYQVVLLADKSGRLWLVATP